MLGLGRSVPVRGTGHILVGDVQCSRECQMCAVFQPNPLETRVWILITMLDPIIDIVY